MADTTLISDAATAAGPLLFSGPGDSSPSNGAKDKQEGWRARSLGGCPLIGWPGAMTFTNGSVGSTCPARRHSGMARPQSAPSLRTAGSVRRPPERAALCPSTGPTPRTPGLARSDSLPYNACAPKVWAPSGGTVNDTTRARNLGNALNCRPSGARSPPSSTSLSPKAGTRLDFTLASTAIMPPVTPRSLRGMVRKSSKVIIDYPSGICHRPSPERPRRPHSAVLLKCKRRTVTFHDEIEVDPVTGQPLSIALSRSHRLLDNLANLRRSATHVDFPGSPGITMISPPESQLQTEGGAAADDGLRPGQDGEEDHATMTRVPSQPLLQRSPTSPHFQEDEEEHDDLLHKTLKDVEDTLDALVPLEREIAKCMDPVKDNGGARHATEIVYGRCLEVLRRKIGLMHQAVDRAEAMEEAFARRDELLPDVAAGKIERLPALVGVKKFIFSLTHHPGNPVDANKSDFKTFVHSFKLPREHMYLERLRELSLKNYNWWATGCLRTAETGASIDDISRVMSVAVGAGAPEDHPDIIRGLIVGAQLVKNRFQAIDINKVAVEDLPFGQPTATADKIEVAIKHASQGDCSSGQHALKEAVAIVGDLRNMETVWRRLAGRARRKTQREASEAST